MEVDFKTEFINIDFDKKLLENNNQLVNSQNHYVSLKQRYIQDTLLNFKEYTNLEDSLTQLQNKTFENDHKVFYTYVDRSKVTDIKQSMKNIVLRQRQMLNNFLKYIEYLNNHSTLLQPQVIKTKRRFNLFKK
jgi:hypothetical protein